tara:strand:+ start:3019 stop:3954 length:936 start_codon:yes stop_codon:yes gene_type:complete
MQFETPILLIVFNRPDKTKILFEKIRLIKPKTIFISADGPRINNPRDFSLCDEVRSIVKNIDWECDYKFKFNEKNLSCKVNVIESINWFFSHNERGIILEDDCIPSKSFFNFCEILLEKYKDNKKIMQINGSNLGIDYSRITNETYFFSKLSHCWGWATWKRAWNYFDKELKDYEKVKKNKVISKYYIDRNIAKWMTNYFDKIYNNEDKIWSTLWSYSILEKNAFCITPALNLVNNIGFDGSGTSGKFEKFSKFSTSDNNVIKNFLHPEKIEYFLKFDQKQFYEKIKQIDPRASHFFFIKSLLSKIRKKLF